MIHALTQRLLVMALLCIGAAQAGTIAPGPQTGGISYSYAVTLSDNDTASFSDHVGAWSWQDNLEGNPVGWTHTSRWVAVTLEKPTVLTLTMSRDATVPWPNTDNPDRKADTTSMFPSFTVWSGWDTDGTDSHSYNNQGDVVWAEDISYLDHLENGSQESITRSWVLPAGSYTFALGSFAPATNPNRQGFKADFTTATLAAVDPVAGAGIGYSRTIIASRQDTGSFSDHVGAWSWEDASLFDAGAGDPPVGWTHTSRWVALRLTEDTLFKVTLTRDANVPWPSQTEPERKADTSSMFPSLTLYRGWDNDGGDSHTYNGRGNVAWAEDITYQDHIDNGTQETITRTWLLPAGDYTLALGSKAPATNPNRQGFNFKYDTAPMGPADPATGGIGYSWTTVVKTGDSGSFSDHVGAWSWEDNALFAPGQPPVGWTHTSRWLAVRLKEEVFFTLTLERDADVPWPSQALPDRKADTSSMFPSLTLYRGWDNDGGDSHTYNNRGNVIWAEGIRYMDHVDNSSQTSISRTWRLPAGDYTLALGSNAPANNTLRQGFKATYSARGPGSPGEVINGDVAPGGIGYAHIVSVGRGDSGSFANHVGAWSWEDNALFSPGQPPVGWTHTSRWLALHVREPLTLHLVMERDANVPWPSEAQPGRMADVSSMYPSFTLWSRWDNDGTDSHTYNNRGPVSWAEDLTYLDHYDNSSQTTITRSYSLAPGYYTLALGSNAPATHSDRQGFRFAWTATSPQLVGPVIRQHPRSLAVVEGKKASLSVSASGPDLTYQWMKDGRPVAGANAAKLEWKEVDVGEAGIYTVEVRNAAGWVLSQQATLGVIAVPAVTPFDIPDLIIGQTVHLELEAPGATFMQVKGLPRGLSFDPKTWSISGSPRILGEEFTVTVLAGNAAGRSEVYTDTFAVRSLPEGLAGAFSAPIGRAASLNSWLGGRIRLQATTRGSVSGQLVLGATTYRFSAPLDPTQPTPETSVELKRRGRTSLMLTLTMNPALRSVSGQVSDGMTVQPFLARQSVVGGAYTGNYTMGMKIEPQDAGRSGVPQGTSVGAFTLLASGQSRGVMLMADGRRFTFASPLENNGSITLFGLMNHQCESVMGLLLIEPPTGGEDSITAGNLAVSEVSWYKAEAPKDNNYVEGFGPLYLEVFGRKYTPQEQGELPLGATPGAANARLTFSDGGVEDPEQRLDVTGVELTSRGARISGTNPASVQLFFKPDQGRKFTPGITGSLKGTFKLRDEDPFKEDRMLRRNGQFQGMVVDDGAGPRGYGFFLLPELAPAGGSKKRLLLSGSVLLEAITGE